MTPEVLLWAYELKREQKNIWDRLKQLESAAPQQRGPDTDAHKALEARIAALETQSKTVQARQDAASGLDSRISNLESKLMAVDGLKKDTAAARSKAEAALSEAKGVNAAFTLLDAEVGDQAKEVKQLNDKIRTLNDGAVLCKDRLQEIEATAGEVADRLYGLDNNYAAFQHDQQDISDDLLNVERKVAGLGKDMQETKDGMSNMLSELKWHLGQLYGHCEKIEIELGLEVEQEEEDVSAGSHEELPLETQPNLERRWDEECGSNVVSQSGPNKPSPNTFKHRQRKTPAAAEPSYTTRSERQKPFESALAQSNDRASFSDEHIISQPTHQYHALHPKTAASVSQIQRGGGRLPEPEQESLLPDHSNDTQQRLLSRKKPYRAQNPNKNLRLSDNAVSRQNVPRLTTPQIAVREEDIETQSPTPSPQPKAKQKRSTLQKETQLLLEPSIHSENRVLQPLTRRTRPASHLAPATVTATGKENVLPDATGISLKAQQTARASHPALASKGKKRAAPASLASTSPPKRRR